jgi:hypothetical protein
MLTAYYVEKDKQKKEKDKPLIGQYKPLVTEREKS